MLFDELFVHHAPRRHHDVDLLLEGDDGEDVGRLQQIHDVSAGSLDVVQGLAFHGPAAVNDQAKVQRQPATGHQPRRLELNQRMLAARLCGH